MTVLTLLLLTASSLFVSSLSLSSSSRSSPPPPPSSSCMPGNGEAKQPSATSSQSSQNKDECKLGRPSVEAFVDSVVQRKLMQEGCHPHGRKPSCRGSLGLLVCGPIGMTRDVCRAAKNARLQGFVVVLDREAFEV